MNTKVANVIAVELGILIVLLAWLAFSNFFRVKQPMAAEEQQTTDGSFATVTLVPKSANQRSYAADYRAGPQGGQLGAQQQAQTMQYDQQVASAPDTSAYPDDSVTSGTSPDYAGVYPQQPVSSPDSFAWPYDPVLTYPPTSEIVVFSNGQAFVRRVAPRFAGPAMTVVHRRPPGGGAAQFQAPGRAFDLRPHGGGVIPRRTANPRSFRPSAGLRPR